ncbi:MAG: hypothetical protein EOM87_03355 [Clostridia bacterium]|nr:hypothetical protein [Clostridia bacterium]
MEGYNIIKKFDTKRNKVFLAERLGKKYIIKRYTSIGSLESEFKVLRALTGKANVPRAIHRLDNEIVMDYIPGDSLSTHYKQGTIFEMPSLAIQFAKFLKAFIAALPGYIINDINYRNYIINNGICYGLDFEFITEGTKERTTAEAVAFGLLVDGVTEEKKKSFLTKFMQEMGVQFSLIQDNILREITRRARSLGIKVVAEEVIKALNS